MLPNREFSDVIGWRHAQILFSRLHARENYDSIVETTSPIVPIPPLTVGSCTYDSLMIECPSPFVTVGDFRSVSALDR